MSCALKQRSNIVPTCTSRSSREQHSNINRLASLCDWFHACRKVCKSTRAKWMWSTPWMKGRLKNSVSVVWGTEKLCATEEPECVLCAHQAPCVSNHAFLVLKAHHEATCSSGHLGEGVQGQGAFCCKGFAKTHLSCLSSWLIA